MKKQEGLFSSDMTVVFLSFGRQITVSAAGNALPNVLKEFPYRYK